MICYRVHLLELGHVNVAESARFCRWLGHLSACGINKHVFRSSLSLLLDA